MNGSDKPMAFVEIEVKRPDALTPWRRSRRPRTRNDLWAAWT